MLAIVGAGQTAPATADVSTLLQKAKSAGERGDYAQSIALYRRVLAIKPEWIPAEFNLAVAYYFSGNYPQAISLFTDVIKRKPGMANAYLLRGISYYNINRYGPAVDSLAHAIQLDPTRAEAFFYLGSSYYQLAAYDKAALAYLHELKIQPQSDDGYFQLVQSYVALKETGLQHINSGKSSSYFALLLQAHAQIERGDLDNAHKQITAALQQDKNGPEAFLLLSEIDSRKGHSPRAQTEIEHARELNTTLPAMYQGMVAAADEANTRCAESESLASALCHATQSQLEVATKDIVDLVAGHQDDIRTLYWADQVYDRLIRAAVMKLSQVAPDSPNLLRLQARGLEQKGQRGQAAEAYEKAVHLDDQNASLFIEYANFCARGRQYDKAVALLHRAVELTPYDDKLQALLAEAYVQNGQPQPAVPYFRRALQADPSNRSVRLQFAQALHTLSRAPEAIAVLKAAPSDPDGRISYMLATYYAQQGDREKAQRAMLKFQKKRKEAQTP